MSCRITRRTFVQTASALSFAGPTILSSLARGEEKLAPSDRINVGFIGVGIMARGHLQRFLGYPDVQVIGVCDVEGQRREHAKSLADDKYSAEKSKGSYKGCAAFNDFRELLALPGLDAVVIGTPDHWHALPAVLAARAKKDIYCEKPLTHSIGEGKKIIEAVRASKVVFQTGSQQRSEFGGKFRLAAELVRNGRIGAVKTVRIGVGGPPVPCDLPEQEKPQGTDWNLWLGAAPVRGYSDVLCPKGLHNHFPAWRNYREYAGGGLADMGAHHFDIAQWALDMDGSGPVKIQPPDGDATSGLMLTYANGVVMHHGGPSGCTFEGEKGTLYVDRDKMTSDPPEILKTPIGEGDKRVYFSDNHHRNWIDCIKSRKDPICTAEIGHRSATVCHLANIGYQLRRALQWDPVKEQFVGDDEANKLVLREARDPWKI